MKDELEKYKKNYEENKERIIDWFLVGVIVASICTSCLSLCVSSMLGEGVKLKVDKINSEIKKVNKINADGFKLLSFKINGLVDNQDDLKKTIKNIKIPECPECPKLMQHTHNGMYGKAIYE